MVPIINNKERKEEEVQNNTKVKEKVANGKVSSFKNMNGVYKRIQKFSKNETICQLCSLSLGFV